MNNHKISEFLYSENGAVTADYVVFTSAVAFSAVAAMDANYDALSSQSLEIVSLLNGESIISTSFEELTALGTSGEGGNGGGGNGTGGNGGGNNGFGNGDQDAPGNSEFANNAENAGGNGDGTGNQGNGNASLLP